MALYDLHSHSTASDGALSPSELVQRALENGVSHLALTDHDGTEGIAAARLAAQQQPITLIPGVEISVTWANSTVHIVGLNIDTENSALQAGLSTLRDYRRLRAHKIAEKLEKSGISGALQGAQKYASETMLGRVHFARFLIEAGHAKDTKDVFKRFLVKNKPGYVSSQWASLEDAVGWINSAGGQAVIAHPARYKMTNSKRRKLLTQFKALDGAAIEVSSGLQHPEEIKTMAKLANEFELLASCGSDFHAVGEWSDVGKCRELPVSVTPIWSKW